MRRVQVTRDATELADRAAAHIAEVALASIAGRGVFTICLSGGETPGATYMRLATQHRDTIPWEQVHVFWGDERCIPLEAPDHHFTMANEILLSKVPIPPGNVHRPRGETDPAEAAIAYEEKLRWFFGTTPPVFDLVILGMGEDGHCASIFPESTGCDHTDRLVVDHYVTKRGERARRLTLTMPVLAAAREILFLVSGSLKAEALADVLEGETNVPARRLLDRAPNTSWFADREAAALLRSVPEPVGGRS